MDSLIRYESWVDKQITKKSGKPFKSGLKIGTVKELGTNPNSNKHAFVMVDDGTYVDCHQCQLVRESYEHKQVNLNLLNNEKVILFSTNSSASVIRNRLYIM